MDVSAVPEGSLEAAGQRGASRPAPCRQGSCAWGPRARPLLRHRRRPSAICAAVAHEDESGARGEAHHRDEPV